MAGGGGQGADGPPGAEGPPGAAEWLAAFGAGPEAARAVAFRPATLKQALDGALALGRAAGRLPEAMRVLAEGEARLAALAARLGIDRRAGTVGGRPAPTVALVVALDPLTLAGWWGPDLVERGGGRPVLVRSGAPPAAAAVDLAADVVIFALPDRPPHAAVDVPPGLAGRPYALDGRRFVNRPGPALVRSAELIAAAVHGPAAGVEPGPDELVALRPSSFGPRPSP